MSGIADRSEKVRRAYAKHHSRRLRVLRLSPDQLMGLVNKRIENASREEFLTLRKSTLLELAESQLFREEHYNCCS